MPTGIRLTLNATSAIDCALARGRAIALELVYHDAGVRWQRPEPCLVAERRAHILVPGKPAPFDGGQGEVNVPGRQLRVVGWRDQVHDVDGDTGALRNQPLDFRIRFRGRLRIRKKSYAKLLAGGVAVIFGEKWRENSSAI
ncbi:hypothetical protein R75461_07545 [Paraburkholderia nemoris]|nr:hypothetical protein R75461_07545 [Paraburkholderia nemoris]